MKEKYFKVSLEEVDYIVHRSRQGFYELEILRDMKEYLTKSVIRKNIIFSISDDLQSAIREVCFNFCRFYVKENRLKLGFNNIIYSDFLLGLKVSELEKNEKGVIVGFDIENLHDPNVSLYVEKILKEFDANDSILEEFGVLEEFDVNDIINKF